MQAFHDYYYYSIVLYTSIFIFNCTHSYYFIDDFFLFYSDLSTDDDSDDSADGGFIAFLLNITSSLPQLDDLAPWISSGEEEEEESFEDWAVQADDEEEEERARIELLNDSDSLFGSECADAAAAAAAALTSQPFPSSTDDDHSARLCSSSFGEVEEAFDESDESDKNDHPEGAAALPQDDTLEEFLRTFTTPPLHEHNNRDINFTADSMEEVMRLIRTPPQTPSVSPILGDTPDAAAAAAEPSVAPRSSTPERRLEASPIPDDTLEQWMGEYHTQEEHASENMSDDADSSQESQ